MRTTMQEAGIDMQQFTPYSCRHATTSAAVWKQVPITRLGDVQEVLWQANPGDNRHQPDTRHLGHERTVSRTLIRNELATYIIDICT